MRYHLLKNPRGGYSVQDNEMKYRTYYDPDLRNLNAKTIEYNFKLSQRTYDTSCYGVIISEADTLEDLILSVPYLFL